MNPAERTVPKVGDEISYRSMEGCTVAVVEEVGEDTYTLDNGVTCPARLVLDVWERNNPNVDTEAVR